MSVRVNARGTRLACQRPASAVVRLRRCWNASHMGGRAARRPRGSQDVTDCYDATRCFASYVCRRGTFTRGQTMILPWRGASSRLVCPFLDGPLALPRVIIRTVGCETQSDRRTVKSIATALDSRNPPVQPTSSTSSTSTVRQPQQFGLSAAEPLTTRSALVRLCHPVGATRQRGAA